MRLARRLQTLACFVLLTLALTASVRAHDSAPNNTPAPEPKKSEPEAKGQPDALAPNTNAEDARHGYDGEADYLALAEAPLFLPRSYLYWGTPVGSKGYRERLIFALEYALHLPIYSNLRMQALQGKRWAGAATLSFEGDLRMVDTKSRPVRMPSYRPSLSGQLFYIWHRKQPVVSGFRTGAFHYSNGQEHCTFDENLRDDSAACTAANAKVTDPVAQLNRLTGNFATNGYMFELNSRVHELNSKGVAIGHLQAGMSVHGLLRHGTAALDQPLRRLYGWGRLQWNVEAKKRFGWASVTLRAVGTYYPHVYGNTPRRAGDVELIFAPFWLTGLGFFARYYGGRDFYNAFFVDRIQQFATGLAWDGERPLKFKRD